MKTTIIIICLALTKILFSQEFGEYDLKPYNHELNFKLLNENDILEKNDSIEALIFVFNSPLYKNAELSIKNNPQLKKIKIFAANQEFIKFISDSKLQQLTHLFIERYEDSVLEIHSFPNIEHLTIQSLELMSLNMVKGEFDSLYLLDIEGPKLNNWSTSKFFPNLGLINLKAPILDYFPIEQMPKISQFMYYCSFIVLPNNLCNYRELKFISFNNYVPVKVSKCEKKIIKDGYVSNLTIYDQINGEKIKEIVSKEQL